MEFLVSFIPSQYKAIIPVQYTSYIPGETPLSTWPSVITALASYLTIIFSARSYMRDKAPLELNTLFRAHNVFLSCGSFVLLVFMAEEILGIVGKVGLWGSICHPDAWTPRLETYYMINYVRHL